MSKLRGNKELLIDILNHRIPRRVPFGELHIASKFIEKYNGRKYKGPKDDIEFSLAIGRDLIKPDMFWFGTKWKNYDQKPFNNLQSLIEFSKKVPMGIQPDMKQIIKDSIKMCYEANLLLVVQLAGVLSYAWSMMGFEKFLVDLMINTDEAQQVIDLITERNCAFARDLADLGVEAVQLSDDIAGNDGILISPAKYREMIKPAMKKIIDNCGDMFIIYHSDGNIEPVLSDLIEIGIDGFQAVEYGLMDLRETKEKHPGLTLFGNVDMSVIHLGTPEEIDILVKEAVEIGAVGGNYAVCSDNSIPLFIPVENFNAYVSAVKKYTYNN
jgi:uroporphyrinogen-III decarboxylase